VVGDRLVFQSFDFAGPSAADAQEHISVQLMEPVQAEVETVALKQNAAQQWYSYEGKYKGGWQLRLPVVAVQLRAFCHQGQQYQLRPWQPRLTPTAFDAVYADVNHAWTRHEWLQLQKLCAGKPLWVYQQQWKQVVNANEAQLFEALHQQQFSLFPFFKLPDAQVLVVAKTAAHTPALKQLRESGAYELLKANAVKEPRPALYLLGDTPDLYLRSLRELRQFRYDHGSLQRLGEMLQAGLYTANEETDHRIVLHDAQLVIERGPCINAAKAPDHLMRLYYYNQLLRQGGPALLANDDAVDSSWLAMAEQAHMVSPVSSLLVLETQADYERFDLKKDQQGLDNAKLQSTGAVPEPHEWAMIILLGLVLLGYYRAKLCAS
jgi:XrtN system VIT domain protein